MLMPWRAHVPAMLEAWYPGTRGGEAIANVLFGRVNPSGHLPVTFYADRGAAAARRCRPGGKPEMDEFTVDYQRRRGRRLQMVRPAGAEAAVPVRPRPSYTSFAYGAVTASPRPDGGADGELHPAQHGPAARHGGGPVYAAPAAGGWEAPKRLVGFAKVDLAPGE